MGSKAVVRGAGFTFGRSRSRIGIYSTGINSVESAPFDFVACSFCHSS